jgi:hypothetical protein
MEEQGELVVVFRSGDHSAEEDAEEIRALLEEAGLAPLVCDDSAPDVPSGVWEVRVPAAQAGRAEELIRAADEMPREPGDPSHDLDLETVFDALGATAEMEALSVRSVLEANGIQSVLVGAPLYPNLRFVVRVPKVELERARQVLEEARSSASAAADETALDSLAEPPES